MQINQIDIDTYYCLVLVYKDSKLVRIALYKHYVPVRPYTIIGTRLMHIRIIVFNCTDRYYQYHMSVWTSTNLADWYEPILKPF